MWVVFTFLTFFAWGIADLFYKIGNHDKDKYSHLKTGVMVGYVMGIHALLFLIFNKVELNILDMIKYLPVSLCYILSMIIGYKGLKYLELSICSPIQNTSGIITALLLLVFFKESLSIYAYIAFILIFIGITMLSIIELNEGKSKRVKFRKENTFKRILTLTILFPLGYCLIDGLGTFLDAIYLDYNSLISEDLALVAYEFTFLIYSLVCTVYLKLKNEKISIFKEKAKLAAAVFETIGQFFYVYAMSGSSIIAAPIIGSYCILSMLLSRVFLKEKLTKKEYIAIFIVVVGIVILGILDI